jgi:hypothetical protein
MKLILSLWILCLIIASPMGAQAVPDHHPLPHQPTNTWSTNFINGSVDDINTTEYIAFDNSNKMLSQTQTVYFNFYYDFSVDKWYVNRNGVKVECILPADDASFLTGTCATSVIGVLGGNYSLCVDIDLLSAGGLYPAAAGDLVGTGGIELTAVLTLGASVIVCSDKNCIGQAGSRGTGAGPGQVSPMFLQKNFTLLGPPHEYCYTGHAFDSTGFDATSGPFSGYFYIFLGKSIGQGTIYSTIDPNNLFLRDLTMSFKLTSTFNNEDQR